MSESSAHMDGGWHGPDRRIPNVCPWCDGPSPKGLICGPCMRNETRNHPTTTDP